jgi:hypothetical protein
MARAHTNQTPVDGDIDNTNAITTGNLFTVDTDRTIHAVQFYAPTTNTGTYTVGLWEVDDDDDPGPSAGTLLESASIASASVVAGDWNRVAIDPTPVLAASAYRVGVHASSGRFVRTAGALTAASISNAGITIEQSGTDLGGLFDGVIRNGTFNEGVALAYPASVFGQPDYFVDVDDESDEEPTEAAFAITTALPTMAVAGVESLSATVTASTPLPTLAASAVESLPVALAASTALPTMAVEVLHQPLVAFAPTTPLATMAFVLSTSIVEAPSGYGPLLDMFRSARANVGVRVAPVACPRCGEPLASARGVLHCRFDGYRA